MSGLGDKLKGSAKEAAGKITDNKKLEAKGKADQAVGEVKDKADAAKEAVEEKANQAYKKAKGSSDDDKK